ncbi:MAG: TIGR03086 family metal-binding protein [Acidimicrobiales bacterium]
MTTDTGTTSTPANPPSGADPRVRFARAVDLAGGVIAAVEPGRLDDPTPCDALDVRSLLGHLVQVLDRVAAIGHDGDPSAVAPLQPVADDGWLDAWRTAAHEVQAAWTDPAVLDRIVVLPWSQVSGGETLCGYLNEISVHTWDLAVATGQTVAWDDEVLAVALSAIQRVLPAQDRAALFAAAAEAMPPQARAFPPPFAEAVDVAPDAPVIDRLVAWNGRQPRLGAGDLAGARG